MWRWRRGARLVGRKWHIWTQAARPLEHLLLLLYIVWITERLVYYTYEPCAIFRSFVAAWTYEHNKNERKKPTSTLYASAMSLCASAEDVDYEVQIYGWSFHRNDNNNNNKTTSNWEKIYLFIILQSSRYYVWCWSHDVRATARIPGPGVCAFCCKYTGRSYSETPLPRTR